MNQVHFMVPGSPVAKARTKHRAIHTGAFYYNKTKGRQEEKIIPQEYTPKESVSFENLVRTCYAAACQDQPWAGPCMVNLRAFFQAPKSLRVWERELAEKDCLPHIKKPDGDNVMKSVKDGLRSVAYVDDNQVVRGEYQKWCSLRPRTEITLTFYTMEELCQKLVSDQLSGRSVFLTEKVTRDSTPSLAI